MLQAEKTMDLLYTKYLKALIDYNGIRREEIFMICIGNEVLAIPMNNQGLHRSFYSKNFSVSKKTKLLLIVEIISAT